MNEDGEASFRTDVKSGYAPIHETVRATMPGGREGDVIWVNHDSGVILGTEGGYLRAKDEASVVIACNEDAPSKIDLLYGKIVGNLKQMWRSGGQIDWEMSQAVLGIKGTTFILEEDGTSSMVKVLEGTVEVTPRGGEPISVSGEQAINIADGMVGEVEPLVLVDELSNWDEDTQAFILGALEEAASSQKAVDDAGNEAKDNVDGLRDDRPIGKWMPYLVGAGLMLVLVADLGIALVVVRQHR
ncbi:MAG: hypothetical protein ACP5G7_06640 [Anaerolineae bacterium]